jgi:hypothetical protein
LGADLSSIKSAENFGVRRSNTFQYSADVGGVAKAFDTINYSMERYITSSNSASKDFFDKK